MGSFSGFHPRSYALVGSARASRVGATTVGEVGQAGKASCCATWPQWPMGASTIGRNRVTGLLDVDATYQPGTTDTAHTLRLPPRFASQPGSDEGSVSVTDPSRSQPPQHFAAQLARTTAARADATAAERRAAAACETAAVTAARPVPAASVWQDPPRNPADAAALHDTRTTIEQAPNAGLAASPDPGLER